MKRIRCPAFAPSLSPLFALAVPACGDNLPPPAQPPGWDNGIRLPEADDTDPDPNVVEVDLQATLAPLSLMAGVTTTAWTYNGLLPVPLIRARVGNRVIVHFTNNLPESTTIHWHGLRIPAAMDGMPGPSQPPTAPGGTFDYDFVVPDASTFWYHPHVDSAAQVGNGLYGPLIVDDPDEPPGLGDEVVLVLSDIGIESDGTLEAADSGGDLGRLYGREGNMVLVNGQVVPTLKARPGLRQRWRIINAAKSRYFLLSMAGHSFQRIGGDGGRLGAPIDVDMPFDRAGRARRPGRRSPGRAGLAGDGRGRALRSRARHGLRHATRSLRGAARGDARRHPALAGPESNDRCPPGRLGHAGRHPAHL